MTDSLRSWELVLTISLYGPPTSRGAIFLSPSPVAETLLTAAHAKRTERDEIRKNASQAEHNRPSNKRPMFLFVVSNKNFIRFAYKYHTFIIVHVIFLFLSLRSSSIRSRHFLFFSLLRVWFLIDVARSNGSHGSNFDGRRSAIAVKSFALACLYLGSRKNANDMRQLMRANSNGNENGKTQTNRNKRANRVHFGGKLQIKFVIESAQPVPLDKMKSKHQQREERRSGRAGARRARQCIIIKRTIETKSSRRILPIYEYECKRNMQSWIKRQRGEVHQRGQCRVSSRAQANSDLLLPAQNEHKMGNEQQITFEWNKITLTWTVSFVSPAIYCDWDSASIEHDYREISSWLFLSKY